MKNILVFGVVLMCALLTPCCKKNSKENNTQRLWDCNAEQYFDSTKLADKLVGSWKWTEMSSEKLSKSADKNVIAVFSSNGKFTVTENTVVITRGNWRLKIVDSGILGLSMDSVSTYLYGRILLCGNEVLFNNSYIDGSDNLFKRTK